MFEFHNPVAFLFLLLIPVLFLLRKLKVFSRITFPAVLSDWQGKTFRWNGTYRKVFSILTNILGCAAYISVVLAFADPVIYHQEKIYNSTGTDVMFVVDTSPSMAAKDIDGNTRMNAAKNTIKKLTIEQSGFCFGVVALGDSASLMVPTTTDHAVFNKRIEELNVGVLGNGSAIGDGLSTAIYHLADSTSPKKVIILLTDGENNSGQIHPETAAELASYNNIKIYVVGIGTKGSVPIEYTDPVTGKLYSGYLDSNFNPASLQRIAAITDGRYYEATTTQELLANLNLVAKTESTIQNYTFKNVETLYYDKFLFTGILLFLIVWIFKRLFLNEIL